MMENFDSKNYRDNLAKDLKEVRKIDKEEAQNLLDNESNSIRYGEAEKIHSKEREQIQENSKLSEEEQKIEKIKENFDGKRYVESLLADIENVSKTDKYKALKVLNKEKGATRYKYAELSYPSGIKELEDKIVSLNQEIETLEKEGEITISFAVKIERYKKEYFSVTKKEGETFNDLAKKMKAAVRKMGGKDNFGMEVGTRISDKAREKQLEEVLYKNNIGQYAPGGF